MSCQHPMFKYRVGLTPEGKQDLRWIHNPNQSIQDLKRIYGKDLVPIPCGRCPGCALDYSKEWAVRCVLESSCYEDNCFITLTFDDDHFPKDGHVHKRDMQLFMKRLRKMFPERDIRFFGCGEYGSKTKRPHYHIILFNLDFYDKKPIGQNLFTSSTLEKLWPFGICSVGSVTMKSCAYVARYSVKKKLDCDKTDEFLLMSRRPGIGRQYYLDHRETLLLSDYIYGSFSDTNHKAKMPRVYEKWLEADGVDLTDLKDRRVMRANQFNEFALTLRGFNHDEQLNKFNFMTMVKKMEFLRRNV